MTTECYIKIQPYRAIIDLFEKTGEYIGGADYLFDNSKELIGGDIDKSCNDCKVGYFRFLISEIKNYEKNNGSTDRKSV